MTQINLLPWREQAKKVKQTRFYQAIGLAAFAAILMVVFVHISYKRSISDQQQRINYLQSETSTEQAAVNALNETIKQKTAVDAEIEFLISTKSTNYQAVRMLDELAKQIPDAIQLKRLLRERNRVLVIGRAASDLQITQLMKNIRKSALFYEPDLTEITTKGTASGEEKVFQLSFVLY